MNMFSVAVITVGSTVRLIYVLGFRDYICTMIFNNKPLISFQAREIDKEMLTFLELPTVNSVGTLLDLKYKMTQYLGKYGIL
jgi:hypothetical protein